MKKEHFDKVAIAMQKTYDWHLSIDDTPRVNVIDIPGICRRVESRAGRKLELIVIDYLQRLNPANPKEPFERQVSDMSVRMKTLAREFSCPVIVLSQMNDDGRLRWSRDAENEADGVWVIEQDQEEVESGQMKRAATLRRTKGRNCGTGDLHFEFEAPYLRFNEVSKPYTTQGDEFSYENKFQIRRSPIGPNA